MEKFDFSLYEKLLAKRREQTSKVKVQTTRHQQDAIDTAKILGDFKSLAIYMNIFKRHSYPYRNELLACRDWVMAKATRPEKGRLFVSVYQKFLKLTSDKEVLK